MFIVDNQIQKANLLKNENTICFMPKFYYDIVLKDNDNIVKVEGFEIEFPLEPYLTHLILVYKHSKYANELIKYQKKYKFNIYKTIYFSDQL